VLATGQADLQPSRIRIDFNAIFPDAAYDLGNPRTLRLGSFDLAFVLVFLVPLAIIAIGGTRLVGEQDSGVLRMIAAQPIALRTVALIKAAAFAAVAVVAVVAALLIALLVTGGLGSALIAGIALLVAVWVMFWVALTLLVASFWRGAVGSIVILVLVWLALTVLAPSVAALAIDAVLPAPSRAAYIDRSRQAMDGFYRDEAAMHEAWLARFPQYAGRATEMVKTPEVKRFARDAFYRNQLETDRDAFASRDAQVAGASDLLRMLSPAMMLDGALQAAAGTDVRRHLAFVAAADAYGERLRRWFEPLALANASDPRRACSGCPGRLNFTRYDEVPRFVPVADNSVPVRWISLALLYLAAAVVLLLAWSIRRLRDWPV
jgi:ABC-2 type transport system permease protein